MQNLIMLASVRVSLRDDVQTWCKCRRAIWQRQHPQLDMAATVVTVQQWRVMQQISCQEGMVIHVAGT